MSLAGTWQERQPKGKGRSFDVCFTQSLGRARETAEIILQGRDVPILEDKRILEMNFGVLEGKCCSKEGWDVPDSFQMFFDDPVHYQAPEGGEDFQAVRERTGDFLNWLFARSSTGTARFLSPLTGRPWQAFSTI